MIKKFIQHTIFITLLCNVGFAWGMEEKEKEKAKAEFFGNDYGKNLDLHGLEDYTIEYSTFSDEVEEGEGKEEHPGLFQYGKIRKYNPSKDKDVAEAKLETKAFDIPLAAVEAAREEVAKLKKQAKLASPNRIRYILNPPDNPQPFLSHVCYKTLPETLAKYFSQHLVKHAIESSTLLYIHHKHRNINFQQLNSEVAQLDTFNQSTKIIETTNTLEKNDAMLLAQFMQLIQR